ncbi:hypothetical protein F511_43867 [Dorcoceras hygrometricum]|uniref:Uncharacterized protein n=1 Tax=Dorcoceras hygrometricum TaxID=472368 RepID=A0A2Z7D1A7_9LAMI|nr:hypothetical protein F511_43867 [Dorcoceras hygrometricum]
MVILNQQVRYLKIISRCFTTISKRCRLNKLTRQRFDLTLRISRELEKKPALTNKEFSSWTFNKANPTAEDLANQFQQRRKFSSNEKFSSDAGFIFSTKNSDFSTRSKILEQKTPPVEIRKDSSRVQGRFRSVTVELREVMDN